MHIRPEGYVGKQLAEGLSSYFVALPYVGIVSIEEGFDQDRGKQLLEELKEGLMSEEVSTLADFDSVVGALILKLNFPLHVSLAIGMEYKGTLYVKTMGTGRIYFRRKNHCKLLISGDTVASGFLKEGDMAIYTTDHMRTVIGSDEDLGAFVGELSPAETIEKIHREEYGEEEQGFVAQFVKYEAELPNTNSVPNEEIPPVIPVSETQPEEPIVTAPIQEEQFEEEPTPGMRIRAVIRNKFFILGVILVLGGLLLWSVVFGYQRRQAAEFEKKREATRSEITKLLADAEENAYLDMDSSLALIAQAKQTVESVKKETQSQNSSDFAQLEEQISKTEASILKREEKSYDEFFDFNLSNAQAQGDAIFVEDSLLAVLDSKAKKVYVLNLVSKNVKQYTHPDLAKATLIGLYREEVYFFNPTKGISKFTATNKLSSEVAFDSEWGTIADMRIFNGNIYLLDTENDEIYKFLVTASGYSSKTSYFKSGQATNLSSASQIMIDGAIYILFPEQILKYLSGAKESFKPQFPSSGAKLDHFYVGVEEDDRAYVLDKTNSSVYVLSKDGVYDQQIQSSIFKECTGIYAFNDAIHVFSKGKVYTVQTE